MILQQVKESQSFPIDRELSDYLREHGNAINWLLRQWVMTTPAQLTADADNYDPRDATVLRLDANPAVAIRGFLRGHQGRALTVINVGANNITLADQHASATAENRIITTSGADLVLATDAAAFLLYDDTSLRWRVL